MSEIVFHRKREARLGPLAPLLATGLLMTRGDIGSWGTTAAAVLFVGAAWLTWRSWAIPVARIRDGCLIWHASPVLPGVSTPLNRVRRAYLSEELRRFVVVLDDDEELRLRYGWMEPADLGRLTDAVERALERVHEGAEE